MTIDVAKQHLSNLVAFPTVSDRPNRDLIDWYADRLSELGARIRVIEGDGGTKANLFATFGPEGDGGIMLSGHTDVVPAEEAGWSSEPFTLREADELLYARGACDMKGFLACALAVAPLYAQGALSRPLHFALTHDEEVGCLGAQSLVEVQGHADNSGSAAYNQDLSERRAQSVTSILLQNGVASGRLTSVGYGFSQPIASNATPEGRAQNRRVQIIIRPINQ